MPTEGEKMKEKPSWGELAVVFAVNILIILFFQAAG